MSSPEPTKAPPAGAPKATFFQLVGAVFWSFLGVRKGTAMSRDMSSIKPLHVILVGIVLAAMLVLTLVAAVRLILLSA